MMRELTASKLIDVRFSEVDSMNVVWHGSYPLYFEDAREAFGVKFGLDYMNYFNHGCFAPVVDLNISYRKPIVYGMRPRVDITYRPSDAAKVVFDYVIRDTSDESVIAVAHSVQVFLDMNRELLWYPPDFYLEWKARWGQTEEE